MAVFRIEKTRDYTVMSNYHLRDKRLSLKAKGLLSQMLSLPEDWDYTLTGLSTINRESKDAIRSAIQELEKCSYIERRQATDKQGKFSGNEYVIHEFPAEAEETQEPSLASLSLENPSSENPTTEKPSSENPTQLNINKQNTNKQNTDPQSIWKKSKDRFQSMRRNIRRIDWTRRFEETQTPGARRVLCHPGGKGDDSREDGPTRHLQHGSLSAKNRH